MEVDKSMAIEDSFLVTAKHWTGSTSSQMLYERN